MCCDDTMVTVMVMAADWLIGSRLFDLLPLAVLDEMMRQGSFVRKCYSYSTAREDYDRARIESLPPCRSTGNGQQDQHCNATFLFAALIVSGTFFSSGTSGSSVQPHVQAPLPCVICTTPVDICCCGSILCSSMVGHSRTFETGYRTLL